MERTAFLQRIQGREEERRVWNATILWSFRVLLNTHQKKKEFEKGECIWKIITKSVPSINIVTQAKIFEISKDAHQSRNMLISNEGNAWPKLVFLLQTGGWVQVFNPQRKATQCDPFRSASTPSNVISQLWKKYKDHSGVSCSSHLQRRSWETNTSLSKKEKI